MADSRTFVGWGAEGTSRAKGVPLGLSEGSFNLRDSSWIIFLLLLERQDVAVPDTRCLLETLNRGATVGRW